MYAAHGGHLETMRELLAMGADPNAVLEAAGFSAPYGNGWSVLMIAAFHGRADAVRLLIERGAKMNYIVSHRSGGRDPNCALACAVMRGGDSDTVRALLDGKAEISCYDTSMRDATCLLAEAIDHGSPEMVPLLLRAGAKANWTSRSGDSLLVMAARDGGQAVNVALLVAQGADLERAAGKGRVAADEGRTPLMIAASAGNASMVQALVDAGARVDQANALQRRMKEGGMGFGGFGSTTDSGSKGGTGFRFAGTSSFSFGQLDNSYEPNPEYGYTALIYALQAGHLDVARMLLRSGADPKRQSASGETAESIARREKLEHLLGL
jgi:ankyrin repeat protein